MVLLHHVEPVGQHPHIAARPLTDRLLLPLREPTDARLRLTVEPIAPRPPLSIQQLMADATSLAAPHDTTPVIPYTPRAGHP